MKKKTCPLLFLALAVGTSFLMTSSVMAAVLNVKNKPSSIVGEQMPEVRFAKSIEDLPLMGGLEIIEDKDVLFIFGAERIAQTTAKGRVDIDSVYYFYQQSLPHMGWNQITARLYERAGEWLHVDASCANNEGMTYVRFSVEPMSQKK